MLSVVQGCIHTVALLFCGQGEQVHYKRVSEANCSLHISAHEIQAKGSISNVHVKLCGVD